MPIKNIIIGTAGVYVFQLAGALSKLIDVEYIKYDEIENIYSTSAGSIIGALYCLNLDWKDLIKYMINKPWGKSFEDLLSPSKIISSLYEKGILDKKVFMKIFTPIFKFNGHKLSMTMKELYEYSNIKLNIYTFNITDFKEEVMNYETAPDLSLLDAIYMSCSLPVIFKPLEYKGKLYLDGGLKNDYPLHKCLEDGGKLEESVGIRIIDQSKPLIEDDSNILSMIVYLLRMFIINNNNIQDIKFENNIHMNIPRNTISAASSILENIDARKDCVTEGQEATEKFLIKKLKIV
jgi:predicted acylesterase/phospholipase RssA